MHGLMEGEVMDARLLGLLYLTMILFIFKEKGKILLIS